MRIAAVDVFAYDLTYVDGALRHVRRAGDRVAAQHRRAGHDRRTASIGFGETCPLGPAYLPATPAAPAPPSPSSRRRCSGSTPANLARCNARDGPRPARPRVRQERDRHRLLGRRSAARRAAGLRRCSAGALPGAVPAVRRDPARAGGRDGGARRAPARAEGIHRFQLKLGADPRDDAARVRAVRRGDRRRGRRRRRRQRRLAAPGRGGRRAAARAASTACSSSSRARRSRSACSSAQRTTLPMVLDEVDHRRPTAAARARGRDGGVQPQVSKVGGLTKARLMRDLADALGLRAHDRGHLGRRPRRPPRSATSPRARRRTRCSPSRS